MRDAKSPESSIDDFLNTLAVKFHRSLEEVKTLIEEKAAGGSGQTEVRKAEWRARNDKLMNNLLAQINDAPADSPIGLAREALLDHDATYREFVGATSNTREDWRVFHSFSELLSNLRKFGLYLGGWSDGSKKDRNQYSNGRLVPHEKSTGYKLEQPTPEFQPDAEEQPPSEGEAETQPDDTPPDDTPAEQEAEKQPAKSKKQSK
jgi:hypothetical protein